MTARSNRLRAVVFTALLTAISVVVNFFRFTVPVGGVPALRITFSGVFLHFASVMFGAAAGGAASSLADVISHFLKPEGAYLPPLTVTIFLRGVCVALIWAKIKDADFKKSGVVFLIFVVVLGCWGVINTVVVKCASSGAYLNFLRQIGAQNERVSSNQLFTSAGRILVTVGLAAASAAILVSYAVAKLVARKKKDAARMFLSDYLKIIVAVGTPCLICTTVNTEILRLYFLLPDRAFVFLWIPRFIEEIVLVLINAYLLMILINVYKKNIRPDYAGHLDHL